MNRQLVGNAALGMQLPAGPARLGESLFQKPLLAFIAIVAALAAIYYGLIASPMYLSVAEVTVRSQNLATANASLAQLSVLSDVSAIQDHVQSQEMLNTLQKKFDLRRQYSSFRIDLFHWLPPHASDEAFLAFYQRMIVVKVDRQSGIVEIDVRSFDKKMANALATAILEDTETFVDGMDMRVRFDALKAAQTELNRAQVNVNAVRSAIANFRGASSTVDPAALGAQVLGDQSALEAQVEAAQADLASALTFNKPDSPIVSQMKARLAAIQAGAARRRTQQGAGGQARQVTSYETLVIQRMDAETRLAGALTAYTAARVAAEQREKYLVRVVNPSMPDKAAEPKRFLDFLTCMIFALAGYAIVSLVIAGIRDHGGV